MDWILANIPFLCVLAILIFRIIAGFKRGIAKEICSVISFILASIAIMLLSVLIRGYFDNDRILFVLTIILIVLLIVVYKIIDLGLVTLKIIGKLTKKSKICKILGAVLGIVETVIITWAAYCLIIIFNGGAIERVIMDCVKTNPFMKFMYEYNYLYSLVAAIGVKISAYDVWGKLGM